MTTSEFRLERRSSNTFARLKCAARTIALLSGTFLALLCASGANGSIAIDRNISADQSTAATSVQTAAFSTTAGNELLLAFVSSDGVSSPNTTVTGITGGGLTWVLVRRTNTQLGTAEVWRAFSAAVLSGVTVKATLSQSVTSSLTVLSFTGVDATGTNGSGAIGATGTANLDPGTPSASIVTTRGGSLVLGVGNDWDRAVARTVGAGQALVHQFLSPVGDTFWVQQQISTTPASGTSVAISDTAPTNDRFNLTVVEVLADLGAGGTGFNVSGTIAPAASGSGASVVLSQGASTISTATADASGNYTFTNIASGTYTVTPSKTGFTFTPVSQSVTVNSANASVPAFTAVLQTWNVTGSITPATGGNGASVVLSQNGTTIATVTANSSGAFSFSGISNGSYTVTPSKTGFTMSPVNRAVTVSNANASVPSFTATANTWTLSGNISAASDGSGSTVVLSQNGSTVASTTADASGNYAFSGLVNGNYTVTPTKTNFTFTPANQAATISDANATGINFTAQAIPTFTISGSITPASNAVGTTVALTGAATKSTTVDASGNYSFSGLLNGAYIVRPSKNGFTFNPPNQLVTINGADQPGTSFTIQPVPTHSISGTISTSADGNGTVLALSGSMTGSATADASGHYTFTGVPDGSYVVTPSKNGFSFTPSTQSVTVNGADSTGVDFTAHAVQPSALVLDTVSSGDQNAASTTVSSPTFSTNFANEALLALVAADSPGSGTNTVVSSVSGGGLTWTLVVRSNTQKGDAEIWRAFATVPLVNVKVTAALSNNISSSITIMSFAGADATGTNGSGAIGATKATNASSGGPTATLTTTRAGSWVLGVGNDYDNAVNRTPGANQTIVHQFLPTVGDTYWMQRQNAVTPASGTSVTINDTAPTTDRYNLAIAEILPAIGGGGGGGTPPVVSMTSPAPNQVVTSKTTIAANASSASFGITGVQFKLDGTNLGAQINAAPYTITWDTTTVASGAHTLTATAFDGGGNSTTSAPVPVSVDNSGNPAVVGSWSNPVTIPTVAVNLILLKNGNVLFYEDGNTPTEWNYTTNVFTNIPTSANLFCSGHGVLADGRVLVVGGYGGSGSNIGIANAEIFDPATNRWTNVPNMSYKRWYPTATTLSDGRVLVTAGWQTTSHSNAGIPEIYDPNTNAWSKLTTANNPFETYPFIFQLPDGRILHVGGTEYPTITETLDLTTQTWSAVDARVLDGASATMYLPNKILKAGSAADSQNVGPSSNTAYVLDMTQTSPAWQQVPSMAYARSFMNLTELPDGTVLVTGGESDKDGGNIANAVYAAELWSPTTQTWTTMASMHTPREYHGTALLLPDGRVLESGMGADFGNVPDQTTAEFYSPAYLFKGPRPTISAAPGDITYAQQFFVSTPDAANITSAVLIRTGAVTHFFDENTRFVPVSFSQTTGGLNIMAPVNGFQAPPGYYMLFLLNSNGVPAVAPIVRLHP